MIPTIYWALPWLFVLSFLLFGVRLPRKLPRAATAPPQGWPRVSVVVPARNEERNIERVLRSLAASDYPDLEIVIVDDRSDDGTAEVARRVVAELGDGAPEVTVVEGADLPAGWMGKPWACRQGAELATGDYILFTDADTRHSTDLLRRVIGALQQDGADVMTLAGRQLMESFWERVVQPQMFTSMLFRYRDTRRAHPPERYRDAIANGQFILFRRDTYDAIGGHGAVRGEVVEDMKLAQVLVREGHTLDIRLAEDAFATRMYESLGEVVRGWSKNVVLGAMATLPPGPVRWLAPAGILMSTLFLWVLPPVALISALLISDPEVVRLWFGVVGVSALFWSAVSARMGVSPVYGVAYPLGALVGAWIFLRAWVRGGRVEWKGRTYRVRGARDGGEPGSLN